MWNRLKTLDLLLYFVPVLLAVVSVLFMYVLTYNQVGWDLVIRQGAVAVLGSIGMVVLTFTDYRAFRAWRYWLYLLLLSSLVLVLAIGTTVFGAKSWIDFGIFQFQPGEVAKVVVGVVLAGSLVTSLQTVPRSQFIWSILLLFLVVGLILLQPDFGTTLCVLALGFTTLFHARLSRVQRILLLVLIGIGVGAIALSFLEIGPFTDLLQNYQKNRLASFIDPARDPAGSGYNVLQSKIAVGSGGIFGKGLGYGSQSQLNFLPVVHADFIFAAIAEAWGLVGSLAIVGLFTVLIIRVVQAARIARDQFGSLLCMGIAGLLLFQLVVNVGMNIGVMPVTGIPLPFLSYGGTAMLTMFLAIGLVQSVVVRSKRLTF